MALISVIVPVYKVEDYLDRCVESILAQTFTDFELILVDDGSPDNCPAMCDAWAEKDKRIKVIHKENGGLSDARNVGIDRAKGEYLSFVDSDDYIHPRMLEILYATIFECNTKLAVGGFCRTDGETLPEVNEWKITKYKTEEFYRKRIVDATIACAKLYHKECFADIRYPIGRLHEDEFVTYQILFMFSSVPMADIPLYGYYRNPNSITENGWTPKRLDVLEALQQQATFFAEHGYRELQVYRIRDVLKYTASFMEDISVSDNAQQYAEVWQRLKKQGRKFLRRNWRKGGFAIEQDGWLIKSFYPQFVKMNTYWLILKRKIGLTT